MSQKKIKQAKKNEPVPVKEQKVIKVLFWGDTPDCATGFGVVSRNILRRLASTGKYLIDVIGINERGGYKDPDKHPYRIFPAHISIQTDGGDFHGRPRLVSALLGKDPDIKPPWDLVFLLNDPFVLEQNLPVFNKGTLKIIKDTQDVFKRSPRVPPELQFKTIAYWPIDSNVKENWIENAINLVDYPVAYTEYCKQEIAKADMGPATKVVDRMETIYHGINTSDFHPISDAEKKEFRSKFFNGIVGENTFLITSVARNQMRKDLARTLTIFAEFLKRRPDSFLYINAQETDAWGSLQEFARNYRILEYGKNWGTPANFQSHTGISLDSLNRVYNCSNCILSTTLGEGFGFYNLEGFATKAVVVAPNNTTHPELFGYDKNEDISDMNALCEKVRGVPVACGTNSSEWYAAGQNDLERIRPLTNVQDAVRKLLWVYDNPDKVKAITDRAYEWVQDYNWDKIAQKWDDLFMKAYNQVEKEREDWRKNPPVAEAPQTK